jgi:tRNA modification GTPase
MEKLSEFGFRHAERGEFSRRAFNNGKMDLAEVESLSKLISARTEKQRARALAGVAGRDGDVYASWRNDMIEMAAMASARMDYAADELPKDINERIRAKKESLMEKIKSALASKARIIESGFGIVLSGATNVGKSSLFNRLLGESRAIVSDIAGTTRDIVSAELDLDGFLARLSDTAGFSESKDEIEKIGIGKTKEEVEKADLVLRIFDDISQAAQLMPQDNEIIVVNKSDLREPAASASGAIHVSAKTGEGIEELLSVIKKKIHEQLDGLESDVTVSDRARTHLINTVAELERSAAVPPDLEAEHIMAAANELGSVLGIIGSDDIYDSVFGQLCLGK